MIPDLDMQGYLPPGEHFATWEELSRRFGGNLVRKQLLEGLLRAIPLFRQAGCQRLWLDGSFVTTKEMPDDIDVCYDRCDVTLLDERLYPSFGLQRREQKRDFRCEFFAFDAVADIDAEGNPISYLEFFKTNRDGIPKGIVELRIDE